MGTNLLVKNYQTIVETYGATSPEASKAFEPLFKIIWQQALMLASAKIDSVYVEDLAAETTLTTWRLITSSAKPILNLRGLVTYAFSREQANLMDTLYQGSILKRLGREPIKAEYIYQTQGNSTFELVFGLIDETKDIEQEIQRLDLVNWLNGLLNSIPKHYAKQIVNQYYRQWMLSKSSKVDGLTRDQIKYYRLRGLAKLRELASSSNYCYADWS